MMAIFGVHSLSSFRDRPLLRLALIGVLALSLGLSACGRKGPLDPPPSVSADGEPRAETPASQPSPMGAIMPGSGQGDDDRSAEPVGPKKRIPLDILLN